MVHNPEFWENLIKNYCIRMHFNVVQGWMGSNRTAYRQDVQCGDCYVYVSYIHSTHALGNILHSIRKVMYMYMHIGLYITRGPLDLLWNLIKGLACGKGWLKEGICGILCIQNVTSSLCLSVGYGAIVCTCLKASFNNVFTLKNLSYMSLHAISVFDKV